MDKNPRTVLITGASSGIGLSTALLFLEKNWHVVCLAKEKKSFDEIKKKCGRNISNIEFHAVDFTDPKSLDAFFQKKDFKFEFIDALVNSAGISSKTKIQNMTEEEWEKIFRVNVTCSFKMIKESIKYMKITRSY